MFVVMLQVLFWCDFLCVWMVGLWCGCFSLCCGVLVMGGFDSLRGICGFRLDLVGGCYLIACGI